MPRILTPRERPTVEEADAWREYLDTIQQCFSPHRYDEVEPWAWKRLQKRLTKEAKND